MEIQADDRMESSLGGAEAQVQSQKESDIEKTVVNDCSSANQAEKISPDESSSDGTDTSKGRPMSPGTLALMCDEQDTMFMAAASPKVLLGHGSNPSTQLPSGQGMTEVYAEQERIVLTKFRDCLNRLITLGEIKETKCSSMVESGGLTDPESNDVENTRTGTRHQQEPYGNGIAKSTAPPATPQIVTAATTASSKHLLSKIPSPAENGDAKSKTEK